MNGFFHEIVIEIEDCLHLNLGKLFLILKNIAPTSVASEQSFSISGHIISRCRARLGDETIDDLCFEKSYFLKEHFYK